MTPGEEGRAVSVVAAVCVTNRRRPAMKIETVDDAKSLVGTTWELNGKQRTITRITDLRTGTFSCVCGNVYWSRPGGQERSQSVWLPYFCGWLSKARQVDPD